MKRISEIAAEAGGADKLLDRLIARQREDGKRAPVWCLSVAVHPSSQRAHMMQSFYELLHEEQPTEQEKMILAAIKLLAATARYRSLNMRQIYGQVAKLAEVEVRREQRSI